MHNIGTNELDAAKSVTMDTERKNDIINIVIIVGAALVLGIYLAATTVVISKDGVGYIELARKFSTNPGGILTTHNPGYPLLVFTAHRFVSMFTADSSVFTWIYSAQSITLLFRLFALLPLYFIGKWLVGSNKSFYAMLILIVLPNPAKMGCEVVREWPYMFFLAAGFLFLLWGAKRGTPWAFALAGLSAGLGYWVRPECGQILLLGLAWLTVGLVWPSTGKMTRWKSLVALALLFVSFALPALTCTKCTGNIFSPNAKRVIRLLSSGAVVDNADLPNGNTVTPHLYSAGFILQDTSEALVEVIKTIGENLMWFFLPFLFIGFFRRMRYEAGIEERFLFTVFLLTNLIMIVARYCYVEPHVSNRWTLPLAAFTVFYIPGGLQAIAQWIENRCTNSVQTQKAPIFHVLFLIGMVVCLPKLLRPAGYDKDGFRGAAKWLNENTRQEDMIAVPDLRISFYAQRQGLVYSESIPDGAQFMVRIVEGKEEEPNLSSFGRKEFSLLLDPRKKTKRMVIYRVL